MIVEKILEILADDKHVEKLVVDQLKMIDHFAGMRIFDLERDLLLLPGVKHGGSELQIEGVFFFIGNSEHQLHVAARAEAGLVGAYVFVHGADVVLRHGRSGRGWLRA